MPVDDSTTRWRGITFAHEGYDGVHGYGGQATLASLDSLRTLGVDALAIVPYTFMRSPHTPAALPIPTRLGTESDSAITAAIRLTHDRGWRVLLKPQIWMHESWPGDIEFERDSDWQAFFDHYHRWMMHYARLAARERVEALCIGTELTHVTLQHPEFWRKLIKDVRQVYSGTLTYAANWGEEFENITFWSELDAVGLDAYYPLSPKPAPTDAELLAGARSWMATADHISMRVGKPLWLTEVGYRSVSASWQNPHAEPNGRAADAEAQARCFRALAAAAQQSPRLTGIFVWKWPSYLGHGTAADQLNAQDWRHATGTGFSPADTGTVHALQQLYDHL